MKISEFSLSPDRIEDILNAISDNEPFVDGYVEIFHNIFETSANIEREDIIF